MRLFFDCTILQNWQGHFTGIQRVIYSLAKGFELLEGCPVTPMVVKANGLANLFELDGRSVGEEFEVAEGDVVLTAAPNWDFPDNENNLLHYREMNISVVSVLYDVIPWKLPHSYGPGFPDIYTAWLGRMIQSSDAIVAISRNSLRDLRAFCEEKNIALPPSTVFRLGDDINEFSTIEKSEELTVQFRKKYSTKYILSVGTIEYRKNHILLLNAFRAALLSNIELPFKLYIVGKEGWLNSDVRYQIENDPLLKGRIDVLEGVSDQELDFLYNNCEFTVYPSIYEGWGLPVAESLRYGKACIASDSSSLVEIAPMLVNHLNPFDVSAWSNQLKALSNASQLREATQEIVSNYVPFSWQESAKDLQEFLISEFHQ
ncbi:glycosyltransferase family 4 protein [Vibrio mediterranei]|uniref:Glycosyltransferase family 1 protein n=1 Tax=Vibrio mediterranei TaxID=689 RepID=A0A3G4V8U5_9VIBR|nr:glycosyltransferase family 1 protein [Vibrio mediterranei]AYV21217.1 glycosyltransferase family 1 protein [Vibrio mediterranei]